MLVYAHERRVRACVRVYTQDMALALTGSSTCTLIAFVFPALLFVQAAKEATGKSDAPVCIFFRSPRMSLGCLPMYICVRIAARLTGVVVLCCVVAQPPPQSQVRMAMASGIAGCIFGTIATIAVLQHGSAGGHGRRQLLSSLLLGLDAED